MPKINYLDRAVINNRKAVIFIDYKPAELRQSKDWIIVYYAKNPISGKLDRFRVRVAKISSQSERIRYAKKIVAEINRKLSEGWSPFFEESGTVYKGLHEALQEFVLFAEKQCRQNVFREDTLRTYRSQIRLFENFLKTKSNTTVFVCQLSRSLLTQYLDSVYLEKNLSPRSRNNYLLFLKMLMNHFIERGYLIENPATGIAPLKCSKKRRSVIPENLQAKLVSKLQSYDDGYFTMAAVTYYCFIRNRELRLLRVSDINFEKRIIVIDESISKNRRTQFVTIPEGFFDLLKNHVAGAEPEMYLFSKSNFRPGILETSARSIQDRWDKIKKELKLPDGITFYSLKDTGITHLLHSGVPMVKVRDQARHSDSSITEIYLHSGDKFDDDIYNSKVRL